MFSGKENPQCHCKLRHNIVGTNVAFMERCRLNVNIVSQKWSEVSGVCCLQLLRKEELLDGVCVWGVWDVCVIGGFGSQECQVAL